MSDKDKPEKVKEENPQKRGLAVLGEHVWVWHGGQYYGAHVVAVPPKDHGADGEAVIAAILTLETGGLLLKDIPRKVDSKPLEEQDPHWRGVPNR